MESRWEGRGDTGGRIRPALAPVLILALACGRTPEPDPAPSGAPSAQSGRATAERPTDPSPPTPAGRIELEVPGEAVGVLLADLDGDGRDELIALTQSPGRLVLWEELPSGSSPLARRREVPVGDFGLGPRALVGPGGRPLLGVASRAERSLTLHGLGGDGRLVEVARLALPALPRALATGVLGEGSGPALAGRAVLATALLGGEVLIWDGGPAASLTRSTDAELPCSLAFSPAGDLLAVGDQGTRSIEGLALLDGALEPVGRIALGGIPRDMLLLDLDGDGSPELLVAGGERELWIFGLGRPGSARELFADPGPPRVLEVGPIPLRVLALEPGRDAPPRLALLAYYGLSFSVLTGLGSERPGRIEAYAGQSPWDLATGDPHGMGRPSLAIANRGAARVSLVLPTPDGGLRLEARVPTGPAPHSLALGDLTGDGLPAAVVLCSLDATLALLPNEGGRLTRGERRPAGEGADDIALADLDGDGHLDAIWLARGGDGLFRPRVARGDGRGGLGQTSELAAPSARSSGDLLAFDLDGDGRAELVVADPDGGRVALRRGADGAVATLDLGGAPGALAILERGGAPHLAVALGDAGERGGIALLDLGGLEGEGQPPELVEVGFVALGNATFGVAAHDLDGDGAADLVALVRRQPGDGPAQVQALLARGADWLRLAPVETGLRPFALAAGDLAGDGVVDVLVSAQNSHHVNRWRVVADPNWRLVRAPDLGAGTGCLDLALADVDGDGRLDLIVANAFSNDVAVLLGAP